MFKKICCTTTALLVLSPVAQAAEPGTTGVPQAVAATVGCWEGRGEVMGKPVTVAVTSRFIVQGALLAVDAESSAIADPADTYSAHLIFGGAERAVGVTPDRIVAFWGDSFGGAFTATGRGESRPDGFDVTYEYPDNAFVNRWHLSGDHLEWQIAARGKQGIEKPFASYSLRRAACKPAKAD